MIIKYEIDEDGLKFWYQNGGFHRLDGPAVEWADGSRFWYQKRRISQNRWPCN
jgi:hypothetical protein